MKSDIDSLQFCDYMENLVDSNSSRMLIDMLRNGNVRYTYMVHEVLSRVDNTSP